MVTATVAVLTIFFAIGTLSPLLITDETEQVVELAQAEEPENPSCSCNCSASNAAS
jgi:hypothetical protein